MSTMTRVIRWLGHPSPFEDHNVRTRLAQQRIAPEIALAFQRFHHNRRISVVRGISTFSISPRQGYSRSYTWGPRYFDLEVEERDWHRLCQNPIERHMMLDVTRGVPPFRPLLTVAEWRDLLRACDTYPEPQTMIAL